MMKVFVQKARFFLTHHGLWTADMAGAMCFRSVAAALEHCMREHIHYEHLLVRDGLTRELRILARPNLPPQDSPARSLAGW